VNSFAHYPHAETPESPVQVNLTLNNTANWSRKSFLCQKL